ncbi:MAG TPA: 3-deoxy-7-phosphoheptulonate synthase [Planctomycetota bacterium]|nr:3-deoxy-7-phosphoheptulonate synthase [Planctomycetota bacterium]
MVVVMVPRAGEPEIEAVTRTLERFGFTVHRSTGESRTVLGVVGKTADFDQRQIEILTGVEAVTRLSEPYKLASRTFRQESTVIDVKGVKIGGGHFAVMAGPCSVETPDQVHAVARVVREGGARILRGGAFKPRTSPYSFHGLGVPGLKLLREAAEANGLVSVTEVMEAEQIEPCLEYADMLQVGARNMQNFSLLRRLGNVRKPILLKRGIAATMEEWLMSAEYLMAGGNHQVILCERGIRTFETYTRNTLDISAIPVVQKRSHLPIIIDPSHATGLRDKVIPVARAGAAVGADGLMVEVHNDPDKALSDGPQALYPDMFLDLMRQVRAILAVVGKEMAP